MSLMFIENSSNLYLEFGTNNIYKCTKEKKYKNIVYKNFKCAYFGCEVTAESSHGNFRIVGKHIAHSKAECYTKIAEVKLEKKVKVLAIATSDGPQKIFKN